MSHEKKKTNFKAKPFSYKEIERKDHFYFCLISTVLVYWLKNYLKKTFKEMT